ncbi:MAG: hypothetical protein HY707_12630 [Ignavibacteriae bacterium]|nr:hypothetical protein [Ignavibacteriota bacterium]
MVSNQTNSQYPRPLTAREREWIDWILPQERAGYREYCDVVRSMSVIGEGRRGKGEIILGQIGAQPDFEEPLAPVFAYGAIETNFGPISITLREIVNDQISVEIVSHHADEVPADFEEFRRWTYSTWKPGDVCPQCQKPLREVPMHAVGGGGEYVVLAICTNDQRVWVYENATQVNRLIPVTNFYNELMLHKNVREPKIAFDSKRLFTDLSNYSDSDLTYAFVTYNKLKAKVHVEGLIVADKKEKRRLVEKLKGVFSRR